MFEELEREIDEALLMQGGPRMKACVLLHQKLSSVNDELHALTTRLLHEGFKVPNQEEQ